MTAGFIVGPNRHICSSVREQAPFGSNTNNLSEAYIGGVLLPLPAP